MNKVKKIQSCRVCGSNFYQKKLNLLPTPPANNLCTSFKKSIKSKKIPLSVVMCKKCKHIQLEYIVSPKHLFKNYLYASSQSDFFKNHFKQFAKDLKDYVPEGSLVVEVGSNDGYLLNELKNNNFIPVGIEPSKKLCLISKQYDTNVINNYLCSKSIKKIKSKYGAADVVLGNNVFAHIDNILESFLLVNQLLKNNGIFIIEVADFNKIVKDGIFDTIYHEHMSYHTVSGIVELAKRSGFSLKDVVDISSHGGSLRFLFEKNDSFYISDKVKEKIKKENVSIKSFYTIEKNIKQKQYDLNNIIEGNFYDYEIIGYGAPAKLVTLMHQMGIKTNIRYVIDDNALKQNKYVPGLGYMVISLDQAKKYLLNKDKVLLIVFPWNLSDEIISKIKMLKHDNIYVLKIFPKVEYIEI